jgi:predicted sulfurtransferase
MATTDTARFRLIDWKTSTGRGAELPFLSLSIRATAELVSVGGPQRALLAARAPFDPTSFGGLANTGTHLSPQDFHAALSAQQGGAASASASAPPPLLVDVRNQFEYDIGHFDRAAPLNCATYAGACCPCFADSFLRPSFDFYGIVLCV